MSSGVHEGRDIGTKLASPSRGCQVCWTLTVLSADKLIPSAEGGAGRPTVRPVGSVRVLDGGWGTVGPPSRPSSLQAAWGYRVTLQVG